MDNEGAKLALLTNGQTAFDETTVHKVGILIALNCIYSDSIWLGKCFCISGPSI